MSEKFIPENVDPFRLAEQNLRIDGAVKIVDMQRLNASRKSDTQFPDEVAAVDLHFGVDEQGQTFLKGHLNAQLNLQCQRCMEHLSCEIISDFALGVVKTLDEAKVLSRQYEPALVKNDGQLALRDLIEDELILNLPIIPRHESQECKIKLPLAEISWEKERGESPFQILQTLKEKQE